MNRRSIIVVLIGAIAALAGFGATALVRQGVGMTIVDCFTAQAALGPGIAMRPLKPQVTFDIHAMFLINRPPGALATDFLKTFAKVIDTP